MSELQVFLPPSSSYTQARLLPAWNKQAIKEFASISGRLPKTVVLGPPAFHFVDGTMGTCFDNPPIVDLSITFYTDSMNGYPDGNFLEVQIAPTIYAGAWETVTWGNTLVGFVAGQYVGIQDQGWDGNCDIRIRYNNGIAAGPWDTLYSHGITC